MNSTPLVTAVLLNWRNSDDTLACLAQLDASSYPNLAIVVVDNGSGDGSAERIRAAYPRVPLICSPVNRGFAGGVNQGIQYAMAQAADYVLLLNSDTCFVPDTIARLVAAAREPTVGVIAPKVYQDRRQRIFSLYGFQIWGGGIRLLGFQQLDQGQFDTVDVDAVAGCAMLISRAAILRAGLMDERFFFYFEDIDYCLRVQAAGLAIRVAPMAQIEHALAGSTRRMPARRQFLLGAHRVIFLRKYASRFVLPLLCLNEIRETINQLRAALQAGSAAAAAGYLAGLVYGCIARVER